MSLGQPESSTSQDLKFLYFGYHFFCSFVCETKRHDGGFTPSTLARIMTSANCRVEWSLSMQVKRQVHELGSMVKTATQSEICQEFGTIADAVYASPSGRLAVSALCFAVALEGSKPGVLDRTLECYLTFYLTLYLYRSLSISRLRARASSPRLSTAPRTHRTHRTHRYA